MYARACRIRVAGTGFKPFANCNVFIEGVKYNHRIQGKSWTPGVTAPLPTGAKFQASSNGRVEFYVDLEGGKFKTGEIKIIVTDVETYAESESPTASKLTASFFSEGTLQVFQRTTSELVVTRISRPWDPVGQGFFTFGTGGPIYISSIDLYFATADADIPVQLQIRKVVGGYPDIEFVDPAAVVDVAGSDVHCTGEDEGAPWGPFGRPTNFKFKSPILLEADQQYCFVVQSNSNAYNLYTAKMGEESLETKKVIFEQPYSGTMYKSQNNFTWVVSQSETLKFRINKAVFDTSTPAKFVLGGNTPTRMVPGTQLFTKTGSNKVIFRGFEQHGYTGSGIERVSIRPAALANAVGTDGNFNGFTLANLAGDLQVSRVIDNYTFEFVSAGGLATADGPITNAGMITNARIVDLADDSPAPTNITFATPPGVGSVAAQADLVAQGDPFVALNITSGGKGYTEDFEMTVNGIGPNRINGITGVGGVTPRAYCSTKAMFVVDMVKPITLFTTNIASKFPEGTKAVLSHKFTTANNTFTTTPLTTDLMGPNYAPNGAKVLNSAVSGLQNQEMNSFQIEVALVSENKNVGPMMNLGLAASVSTYANVINDQAFVEDMTATDYSSGITEIVVTQVGNYQGTTPTVSFEPADDEISTSYVLPTATAVMSGDGVASITIVTPGSGFTRPPNVIVQLAPNNANGATAYAKIAAINTELAPTNGRALARYITKPIEVKMPSVGIKIRSVISSTPQTSVDWYIKAYNGNSEADLDTQPWMILKCDSKRNRSVLATDVFEYEFYLDDIPDFTTYRLKAVMSSTERNQTPYIRDYKVIITA